MSSTRQIIKFNIKFVTPLLIGGANGRDANGLSGKALRGCWRFWCRAMIGGVVKDINRDDLTTLESKIFGSDKIEIGSKFRLMIEERHAKLSNNIKLGFTYKRGRRKGEMAESKGFEEGTSYSITIILRKTMKEYEINVLAATIWLWGNLGAVGNRSRRGFGSPAIYIDDGGKNPFTFDLNGEEITFPIAKANLPFKDLTELKDHLQKGLISAWDVYEQWINDNSVSTVSDDMSIRSEPKKVSYFILQSLEQVAVGDLGYVNRDGRGGAITAVHGMQNCDGLGWADERGRMASPVFIRFHKVVGKDGRDEFLPIVTWCKQKNVKDTKNCAENYLKRIKIGGRRVFTHDLRKNYEPHID